ncbi:MAG: TMEM175 family protein [Methanobacterium sp.]|nr:TMEM175 family protein [Methanobacterium sp.]
METFVDGVFAIAITILVLEFVVPVLEHSNVAILNYLNSLWIQFLGYFLAFFLLGLLLNNHSRQFRNIEYVDQKLWWLNIVLLSFIVLVPFVTSIWIEYGDTTIGVLSFHIDILISGIILYINWSYVKNHKYLLRKNMTSRSISIINYRNLSFPIASIIAIGFAFFTPILSNVAYLLILIIMFITLLLSKLKIKKKNFRNYLIYIYSFLVLR